VHAPVGLVCGIRVGALNALVDGLGPAVVALQRLCTEAGGFDLAGGALVVVPLGEAHRAGLFVENLHTSPTTSTEERTGSDRAGITVVTPDIGELALPVDARVVQRAGIAIVAVLVGLAALVLDADVAFRVVGVRLTGVAITAVDLLVIAVRVLAPPLTRIPGAGIVIVAMLRAVTLVAAGGVVGVGLTLDRGIAVQTERLADRVVDHGVAATVGVHLVNRAVEPVVALHLDLLALHGRIAEPKGLGVAILALRGVGAAAWNRHKGRAGHLVAGEGRTLVAVLEVLRNHGAALVGHAHPRVTLTSVASAVEIVGDVVAATLTVADVERAWNPVIALDDLLDALPIDTASDRLAWVDLQTWRGFAALHLDVVATILLRTTAADRVELAVVADKRLHDTSGAAGDADCLVAGVREPDTRSLVDDILHAANSRVADAVDRAEIPVDAGNLGAVVAPALLVLLLRARVHRAGVVVVAVVLAELRTEGIEALTLDTEVLGALDPVVAVGLDGQRRALGRRSGVRLLSILLNLRPGVELAGVLIVGCGVTGDVAGALLTHVAVVRTRTHEECDAEDDGDTKSGFHF